ncbi:MAG: hypothetical protein R3B13_03390 [Polyangiaceae bacterium]
MNVERILKAARWGSALAMAAGCGSASEDSQHTATNDAGLDSSTGGYTWDAPVFDAWVPTDASSWTPLEPYPETLSCSGPFYDSGFGFHGQCCERVICGPRGEEGTCTPASEVGPGFPGFPPGSGSCTCGTTTGPYLARPTDSGPCCYIVPAIGCDGRPLRVASQSRLAPLIRRRDWSRT